eukprot:SAG31_NODE_31_length_32474_cov_18.308139_10_plen_247_part_00
MGCAASKPEATHGVKVIQEPAPSSNHAPEPEPDPPFQMKSEEALVHDQIECPDIEPKTLHPTKSVLTEMNDSQQEPKEPTKLATESMEAIDQVRAIRGDEEPQEIPVASGWVSLEDMLITRLHLPDTEAKTVARALQSRASHVARAHCGDGELLEALGSITSNEMKDVNPKVLEVLSSGFVTWVLVNTLGLGLHLSSQFASTARLDPAAVLRCLSKPSDVLVMLRSCEGRTRLSFIDAHCNVLARC